LAYFTELVKTLAQQSNDTKKTLLILEDDVHKNRGDITEIYKAIGSFQTQLSHTTAQIEDLMTLKAEVKVIKD
jgi:CII-binding regulator of phage lambda lysogenization HflD